jgi:hypothetical protein
VLVCAATGVAHKAPKTISTHAFVMIQLAAQIPESQRAKRVPSVQLAPPSTPARKHHASVSAAGEPNGCAGLVGVPVFRIPLS